MTAPTRNGSELRVLIAWAKRLGFSCDVGGKHLIFRRPNTRHVYASYTPSCPHARKRTRQDILRALAEAEHNPKD